MQVHDPSRQSTKHLSVVRHIEHTSEEDGVAAYNKYREYVLLPWAIPKTRKGMKILIWVVISVLVFPTPFDAV